MSTALDEKVGSLIEHSTDELVATHGTEVRTEHEALRQFEEREEQRRRASAKCGIPRDDPDFEWVIAQERKLDHYMEETERLTALAEKLYKQASEWRARARDLSAHRPKVSAAARGVMRENRVFQGAAGHTDHSHEDLGMWPLDALRAAHSGSSMGSTARPAPAPTAPTQRLPAQAAPPPLSARSAPAAILRSANGTGSSSMSTARTLLPPALDTARAASRESRRQSRLLSSGERLLGISPGERVQSYKAEIDRLQSELRQARAQTQQAKAGRAAAFARRAEMEDFFLACARDLRAHTGRRKELEEQAILNNIHRPVAIPCKGAALMQDRVIEVLANSEDFLVLLYERLFPKKQSFFGNLQRPSIMQELDIKVDASPLASEQEHWDAERSALLSLGPWEGLDPRDVLPGPEGLLPDGRPRAKGSKAVSREVTAC